MPSTNAERWAAVRFDSSTDGWLHVRTLGENGRWEGSGLEGRFPLPRALEAVARGLVLPTSPPDGLLFGPDPITRPAALFIDAPVALRALPLEELTHAALQWLAPQADLLPIRWVRKLRSRGPFRLPLRIAAVGTGFAILRLIDQINSLSWYRGNPNVERFGMHLERFHADGLHRKLMEHDPFDVIFASPADLTAVTRAARGRNAPALVAVLDEDPSPLSSVALTPSTAHSTAWLSGGPGLPEQSAVSLVYELVHDLPLHLALHRAVERNVSGPRASFLLTSPEANFTALRLSDAVRPIADQSERLALGVNPGDVERFAQRLDPERAHRVIELVGRAADAARRVGLATQQTRLLSVNYEQEATGVVPLANAVAALADAELAQREVTQALAEAAGDPQVVSAMAEHQQRVVDIAMARSGSVTPVKSNHPLVSAAEYRLRVHIGQAAIGSLLGERPPSVDPLLPDPPDAEGHELEIVVFGHDFAVLSANRRKISLPRFGPSEPVWFDLRAPKIYGHPKKDARARVAVYHRNHLLQSFVITATVADAERSTDGGAVQVELEFSETSRFTNLDFVGRRALSIALNDDPAGGTHTLMWKRGDQAADVNLTAAQVSAAAERFRHTLAEATFVSPDSEEQRFPLDGPVDWDAFDQYVRQLARDGSAAYRGLFTSAGNVKRLFIGLGEEIDEPIQIVLHSHALTFPWGGLYDLVPPDEDDAPVCLGGHTRVALEDGSAPRRRICNHRPPDRAFCVHGFWGIRHQLEHLLDRMGDPIDEVARAPGAGRVLLALGEPDEPTWVEPLATELPAQLGSSVVGTLNAEDVLDVLWSADRPSVVVLLGHLEDDTGDDPTIAFLGGGRLRSTDVHQALWQEDWQQPHSMVLLMACSSAGAPVGSLVRLVDSFAIAPAGAVVGTESPIVPSLASRFAADVTVAFWHGATLGAAMTDARRKLIHRGNPLGFAFSGYGNVDLRLMS